jgi:hypothetical protein
MKSANTASNANFYGKLPSVLERWWLVFADGWRRRRAGSLMNWLATAYRELQATGRLVTV